MPRTMKMFEEIIKHLKLYPIKRILIIGDSQGIFLNRLQQVFKEIEIDLLDEVSLNLNIEGYHQIVSLSNLSENDLYDVVVFAEGLDELEYEAGYCLINQLLKVSKQYVLLMTDNDHLNQGKWLVTDFRKYDVSYFNLLIDGEIKQIFKLYVNKMKEKSEFSITEQVIFKPLKITYVMPHKNLTGGLKMLYEQMKSLQKRGHRIQIILKGNCETAKADWVADFIPDEDTVIAPNECFLDYIKDSQLIFAGFYHQLQELVNDSIPVLYWEQGHEALYGDYKTIQNELILRKMLKESFSQDIYLASDSMYVQQVLEGRFHQKSYLLPNYIDTEFYYPVVEKNKREEPIILLVGNPALSFKGFEKALTVLLLVWNAGLKFKVAWACQFKPDLPDLPYKITFYEHLPQEQLAALYRNCDILLSCSLYEGCPMPPLEAMASGVAVVATDCGGIKQYATHLENALICQTHQVQELAVYVARLIEDEELRNQLIQNGLKTAQSLNYEKGGEVLEKIALAIDSDFSNRKSPLSLPKQKKKVLFMIGTLLGGGAEKVLTNIVKYIDKTRFEVTVQTVFDQGIYIDEVKKYAKYKTIFKTVAHSQEELESLESRHSYLNSLSAEAFSNEVIDETYDIEVAFLEDQSTKIIAYSPNKCSRKIAWVHIDLSADNNAKNLFENFEEQYNCYLKFDHVVCVSETARSGFIKTFNINQNVSVIYNPIDVEDIMNKSQEYVDDIEVSNKFKIVSVGRLLPQKGYDRLLLVHQKLINEGYDYELWILGDGIQKELFQEFIKQNNLEENVKLLGFKSNPYKYMECCDLFVCSSRFEGYSLVVAEALVLGLPVISTNCSGPNELISWGKYGVLVENNLESIYKGIKTVLDSTILYKYYQNKAFARRKYFDVMNQLKVVESCLLNTREEGIENDL